MSLSIPGTSRKYRKIPVIPLNQGHATMNASNKRKSLEKIHRPCYTPSIAESSQVDSAGPPHNREVRAAFPEMVPAVVLGRPFLHSVCRVNLRPPGPFLRPHPS